MKSTPIEVARRIERIARDAVRHTALHELRPGALAAWDSGIELIKQADDPHSELCDEQAAEYAQRLCEFGWNLVPPEIPDRG